MKVLASSVLAMEILVMGFAVLFASKGHTGAPLVWGGVIAALLVISAATLRRGLGWILGSIMQVAMIGYGFVATTMFFLGTLFLGFWIAAIVVGRKGEAARAALLQARETKGQ